MATVGQRIKAAQAQAGIPSVEQLAEMPGRPSRFGAKTIGRVIRGERPLEQYEAAWLAETLGVDASYFAETPTGETQLDRIEAQQAQILANQDTLFTLLSGLLEELGYEVSTGDDESLERLVAGVARAQRALRDANARQTREVRKHAPRRSRVASA